MKARGFTLIEILIAILILGIVLSTVYASYTGTFRIVKETEYEAEVYGMARTALDRITRDLQSAAPWGKEGFAFLAKSSGLGNKDFVQLAFRAAAHVSFSEKEAPGGIALIEYIIEEGTEKTGYVLTRNDSLFRDPGKDETPTGGFVICERIETLTYRFFDETGKEYDTWDSGSSTEVQKQKAPASVLIRLAFVNEADPERPYVFATRVHLPFHRVEK